MKQGPITPKGFRDTLPEVVKKRREIFGKIAMVLEDYGFVPLETPSVEYADTLLGKYGEEEKLIYQFTDRGGRKLALRYDLTVPLARFVANNLKLLNPTFSRYQIGQVFRGENPQRGRFREFTQFDFDIVGKIDTNEDARVIAAAIIAARKIGLEKSRMAVNDRRVFSALSVEDIRAIDKIYKVGKDNTEKRLVDFVENQKPTENLKKLFNILEEKYDLKLDQDFFFDPTLARGQDYYTGTIMELKPNGRPEEMSIGGGGRYDNLIGTFANRPIPAVGFSFGIDRLLEIT